MAVTSPAHLPYPENLLTGDRHTLVERFTKRPVENSALASGTEATREPANVDFELLGTAAAAADVTFSATGGIVLATHGGATDSSIVTPHLDTVQSSWAAITWLAENQPWFLAHVRTPASIANTTYWLGFKKTNTPVVATDLDQVFFRFQHGTDTNWQCVTSVNDSDVSQDSGVPVAAATSYRLWIKVDSDRKPHFFINGSEVAVGAAMTAGVTLIPYIGVLSATDATAKSLIVRNLVCSLALS